MCNGHFPSSLVSMGGLVETPAELPSANLTTVCGLESAFATSVNRSMTIFSILTNALAYL